MQNYRLGDYIRQRRQELNLTQEQVCAGICEPVTLSRFENGRQTPSRTRINAILQRLGLPDDRYYALVTPEELEIEALKKEIVACNALKHVNEGFDKISQLEKIVKPDDQITQQFIHLFSDQRFFLVGWIKGIQVTSESKCLCKLFK